MVLSHALEQMIRENVHIACVVGPDGSVAGLITLENILEELVGDIGDEYDRLPTHIHALSSGWIVGGGVPVREIVRMAGLPEPAGMPARETLAEWCEAHAAGALNNGDMVRHGGLECMVRKMRRRRLMEAVVRRSDD